MGIENIGGTAAAVGVDKRGYQVPGGLALITDSFDAGFFIFRIQAIETGDFAGGSIQLYDGSDTEIASLNTIEVTGGASGQVTTSYLSDTAIAKIKVSGSVTYDAYLEVERYDAATIETASSINASTTYTLSSTSTVYVFGGGGGGGGNTSPVGQVGVASSFDATTGNPGQPGTNIASGGTGGNGGSGGGGAGANAAGFGLGGQNGEAGADGTFGGTAAGGTGSGTTLALVLPASIKDPIINRAGHFYCGGNGGGAHTNFSGENAAGNTAGGGGGGSHSGGGGASGGGGSGYVASGSYPAGSYTVVIGAGGLGGNAAGNGGSGVVWVVG